MSPHWSLERNNSGSGVVGLVDGFLSAETDTHSLTGKLSLLFQVPTPPVYDQPVPLLPLSEGAELSAPGVADDEAAGCVRAGRPWRRQRDPVLQNRAGTTDGERNDNEKY